VVIGVAGLNKNLPKPFEAGGSTSNVPTELLERCRPADAGGLAEPEADTLRQLRNRGVLLQRLLHLFDSQTAAEAVLEDTSGRKSRRA
jgi:hypothetical protein